MYPELYEYLLLHNELSLPGIGTLSIQRSPARLDFPSKRVHPPVYQVALQDNSINPGAAFFAWLGKSLRVSDRDAVIRFNDFLFDIKRQIQNGDIIDWNGVGTVSKSPTGDIRFQPFIHEAAEDSLPAEKILREKAEHKVRVGEEEKTAAEMEELLTRPEVKRSWWWAYALIVGLAALVFIGWYLSEHGVETTSVANVSKLVTVEPADSYHSLP